MKDDMVLPGFVQALEGMQIEETRRFNLPVPEVYAVDELATKALEFTVTLKAIKQKELPPLDDALAGQVAEGATLESLTDVLRRQLEEDRKQQAERTKRNQIIDYLVSRVECELPQSYLKDETRRIMSDIVQQNQELGVSEEALRKNQKNIVSAASRSARDRLKANFILERIAQEEGMKVEPDELRERIRSLANQNGTSYEKLLSDLQTRGVLSQLQEEILLGKVLDFLSSNATVQASSGEAAPPA
jgi:trigger factor